jgi:hypothetical protein
MRRKADAPRRMATRVFAIGGALALLAGLAVVSVSTASPTNGRSASLYSVATEEQYVNNADDRARGIGDNPFGNYKDTTSTSKNLHGPFPGDEAIFGFDVYSGPSLSKRVGSGLLVCQYNFAKNAVCDASYQLTNGSLIGMAALNFSAGTFTVAITGGTGAYANATGDLEASPGPRHSQHLVLELQRA